MRVSLPFHKLALATLLGALAAGCGGGSEEPSAGACSIVQLEAQMDATLSQAVSEVDFSYAVQRQDGRQYTFNRGSSTLQTSYESASTSKLVSAVIILRLVEQGHLSLADQPQRYILDWPILSGDSLYAMNLAQLLSFTSGLAVQPEVEPACLNDPNSDLHTCVISIANTYAGNGIIPGSQFLYASTHMHVAGLMAVRARGAASWQQVFAEFQSQTGLFPTSTFDLPSVANPRIAGGMHLTGEEYMAFLKALRDGQLLDADLDGPAADRPYGVRHHRLLADIRGHRGRRGPRRGLALRLRPVARMPERDVQLRPRHQGIEPWGAGLLSVLGPQQGLYGNRRAQRRVRHAHHGDRDRAIGAIQHGTVGGLRRVCGREMTRAREPSGSAGRP